MDSLTMVGVGVPVRAHLATLLDDLRRFGDQLAVVRHQGVRRRATSYAELVRMAGRFAALLEERGVEAGERVLLWAENSAEWIAAFYGCVLRGVLAVPLDPYGSADFAARVCAEVKPRLAVGDGALLRSLSAGVEQVCFEAWPEALPPREAGPAEGLDSETPLQILFTSGTTGDPKGVVHTHGNVMASVQPIEEGARPYLRYARWVRPLRILQTTPLSHVYGQMMGLWVPPIFAAELHFVDRLAAAKIIATIRAERISVLAAAPRLLALLKAHLESAMPGLAQQVEQSADIPAWRKWIRFRKIHAAFGFKFWALISGGGALPEEVEGFWSALGFVLAQGYGMTETTALVTLNHPFHVARGSIGKPLPGREVRIGKDSELLVRGPMIARFTWSGGQMRAREEEWLATGDLAAADESGAMRFLGRKSETIVTAAGLNIHPEDLESLMEQAPGVNGCVVLAIETAAGPEPCAVLACRGEGAQASAVESVNARLASFQRIRRWVLWPEPDLPRTSTGKVKRREVAAWLERMQRAASDPASAAQAASSDWLAELAARIAGEAAPGVSGDLRLEEDFHLDSLGRVQLAAVIEEKLGVTLEAAAFDQVATLGELRRLLAETAGSAAGAPLAKLEASAVSCAMTAAPVYPIWPWLAVFRWTRIAFLEGKMRPLIWLLAAPKVYRPLDLDASEPMLIVANHVTAFDGPLVLYGLPKAIRRRVAVAMSAEMLNDFRHGRNPESGRRSVFARPAYCLLTWLFNVFPLPARLNFQSSFAHAGKAMDRGHHVLVFPEGTRSADGVLADFRRGIGLLVKQTGARVLPVALRGLGEIKTGRRRWFRSGMIEIYVGEPMRFAAEESEASIVHRLRHKVAGMLGRY